MRNDGGPAFPTADSVDGFGQTEYGHDGMTLRDYFATKAMQGMMARIGAHDAHIIAHDAYIVADAMLKARENFNE